MQLLSAKLCVLASSSSGNCSLLALTSPTKTVTVLIDAGLSPRKTMALMERAGHEHTTIDHVLLTHLDVDHWNSSWLAKLPESTLVHLHKRHTGRASRSGLLYLKTHPFDSGFELVPGVHVSPLLVAHDELGTAAFRIEFEGFGTSLGYATDTGRPTSKLCDHLAQVDVLAIESNYCPKLQMESARPAFLKDRIMGGRGHLSNQESAAAVASIKPRRCVVLLHLSRECNKPEIATHLHQHAGRDVIVASADSPSNWVDLSISSHGKVIPNSDEPVNRKISAEIHIPLPRQATLWG